MPKKLTKTSEYKTNPILYIVVPCYNEQETIDKSSKTLLKKLDTLIKNKDISAKSKIMFVNDGSKDQTREKLIDLTKKDKRVALINFTSNYGHQSAIYAGMITAKDYADIVVTIDADLQQDINALEDFINAYKNGCDVVYGIRNDRSSDSLFKKFTASSYYRLMRLLGSQTIPNSADYRLLSKKALNALAQYKESGIFLRGLIPTMGFKSDVVYFDVKERELGQSKYTFKKMFNLALDGITSFSMTPLRFVFILGSFITAISFLLMLITLIKSLRGDLVMEYSMLINIILLSTGLIMVSLGIVGEYIGKTYIEVKQRPRYIIDSIILNDNYSKKS